MTLPDDLATAQALVDQHCHGVLVRDLDRAGLEELISEGGAPAAGATNFDTPAGLAIRRHCAPVLDLPTHAPAEDYLARRTELGAVEAARRLISGSGTAVFCVDTGLTPDGLTTPDELARLGGGTAHEIVRLETVAEEVAAAGVEPGEFADRVADAVAAAVRDRGAVGVKSVAAYRVGLAVPPRRPGAGEIAGAAATWLFRGAGSSGGAGSPGGAGGEGVRRRLDHPVLIRHLLAVAVDLGSPIQFHVGYGDADIRMHQVDPSLLTDWLHTHRVPVVLLHCWPYHRQAGYLAAVHPHVYQDVGLALHYVGPGRSSAVLAEAAELTPFGKLLYSSDAYAVPEFFYLGARAFRVALAGWLTAMTQAGEWSAGDARRIAHLVSVGNACRLYGLPEPERAG